MKLHEISNKKKAENSSFDVILIHGLGGDSKSTWTDENKNFWPSWLDEELTEANIKSLEYPAEKVDWVLMNKKSRPLLELSNSILELLTNHGIGKREFYLITHSMGGIIAKSVLRKAKEGGIPAYRSFEENINGIVFLGTPHSGSGFANLGLLFNKLFDKTLDYFPIGLLKPILPESSENIKTLQKDSSQLLDLSQWFSNNSINFNFKVLSFYENDRIGPDLIVSKSSADPKFIGAQHVAAFCNHFQLSKFQNRENPIYLSIKQFIYQLHIKSKTVFSHNFEIITLNNLDRENRMTYVKDITRPFENKLMNDSSIQYSEEELNKATVSKYDLDRILLYIYKGLQNYYHVVNHKNPLFHIDYEFKELCKITHIDLERKIPTTIPLYYSLRSFEKLTCDMRLPQKYLHELKNIKEYITKQNLDEGGQLISKIDVIIQRCVYE